MWFKYGLMIYKLLAHGCAQGIIEVVKASWVIRKSEKKLSFFSLSQIFGVPLHLEVTCAWFI